MLRRFVFLLPFMALPVLPAAAQEPGDTPAFAAPASERLQVPPDTLPTRRAQVTADGPAHKDKRRWARPAEPGASPRPRLPWPAEIPADR